MLFLAYMQRSWNLLASNSYGAVYGAYTVFCGVKQKFFMRV